MRCTFNRCCYGAFVVRLCLVVYGEWQDRTMIVKYTDVDYRVFTDAARYMSQGSSPYERATYRYTPLLAGFLIPNVLLSTIFGKIVFILCDVLTGGLVHRILKLMRCPERTAVNSALLWLYNPLPMIVSSRGNAESLMALLVVSMIYTVMIQRTKTAAVIYAISVHVKIYPVTYCVPLYFLLGGEYTGRCLIDMLPANRLWRLAVELAWPNKQRLEFVGLSVAVFGALTLWMYICYGDEFLHETYLYHITRRDVRHNFSPYFYLLYLMSESSLSIQVGLLVFLPQMVLLIAVSVRYYRDIVFCCFVHTFLFVTFNKVCTSQYFLWYLCLLPLVIPTLNMKVKEGMALAVLWFASQILWLYYAFQLEFEGLNTFTCIWLSGLVFFAVNITILARIMMNYEERRTFIDGKLARMHVR